MSQPRARFTMELSLVDHHTGETLRMAVNLADNVIQIRFNPREVEELKAGIGVQSFETAVEMIKSKEYRRKLFMESATNLGHALAERMEDAEGWHDQSRVEPARVSLGAWKVPY